MPERRRLMHMSRADINRMASAQRRARREQEREEEERREVQAREAAVQAAKKAYKPEPIEMIFSGCGGHHCRMKDGAKTHVLRKTCFRKRHAGICPTCHHPVSSEYGCKIHKFKRDELHYENIIFPVDFK